MEYSKLVEIYERIEGTTKRLEKTYNISEILRKTDLDDIEVIILLLQGRIFPAWDQTKIGISSKLILKAINKATGTDINKIESHWKKLGDLGLVAQTLTHNKAQATLFSSTLTVKKVYENIKKLALITGTGTVDKKISLIAELLTSAKPLEAKYIVRTVLEELRVGVGEGSLRDAIVWAYFGDSLNIMYDREKNDISLDNNARQKYNETIDIVQHAIDVANEFAIVARTAKSDGLNGLLKIKLRPGSPIKVMLCQKVSGVKEGFEKVGSPAQIEYKYDGFRMQIHKVKDKITLYTRRLENVTAQFPEVVDYVFSNVKGDDFIIDGEAVGFDPKTKKYLAFQSISQRIKRKYDIDSMSRLFPVELNLFDVIYHDGQSSVDEPLFKRRELLRDIVKQIDKKIVISKIDYTDNIEEAQKFYTESLDKGNEGIIMKNKDSIYKPGSRVGGWVKIKPTMESVDVVIVGAEWGEGKRSGWLTSFAIAIIDSDNNILDIGKVGTGIKELDGEGVSFDALTKMLKPLILSEKGKEVKIHPEIVIEVDYEEIQKSPTYSSGYALRFPRLVRLRDDKNVKDCSTLEMIEEFYFSQRGRG